jgi:hypothetical protein
MHASLVRSAGTPPALRFEFGVRGVLPPLLTPADTLPLGSLPSEP